MAKKLADPVNDYSPLAAAVSSGLIDAVMDARPAPPPSRTPAQQPAARHIEPPKPPPRVQPLPRISAGPSRVQQKKIAIRDDEKFMFDSMATAMSEACGTRVSVNNLFRAAMIVLFDCRDRIIEQTKTSGIVRPHNHDTARLEEFEHDIAKMIARAAARSRLSSLE